MKAFEILTENRRYVLTAKTKKEAKEYFLANSRETKIVSVNTIEENEFLQVQVYSH